jgi:hypothetical protein
VNGGSIHFDRIDKADTNPVLKIQSGTHNIIIIK